MTRGLAAGPLVDATAAIVVAALAAAVLASSGFAGIGLVVRAGPIGFAATSGFAATGAAAAVAGAGAIGAGFAGATTGGGVGGPSSSAAPSGSGLTAGTILLSRISPGGGAFTAVTSSVSFTRLMRSFVVGIFWCPVPALAPRGVPPFPPEISIRIPSLTLGQAQIRGGSAACAAGF